MQNAPPMFEIYCSAIGARAYQRREISSSLSLTATQDIAGKKYGVAGDEVNTVRAPETARGMIKKFSQGVVF